MGAQHYRQRVDAARKTVRSPCFVNELVHQHNVPFVDLLAQRPDGADRDDPFDTQDFHAKDVGAVIYFCWQVSMAYERDEQCHAVSLHSHQSDCGRESGCACARVTEKARERGRARARAKTRIKTVQASAQWNALDSIRANTAAAWQAYVPKPWRGRKTNSTPSIGCAY